MVIDADVADPRSFPDRVNPAFDLEIERAAASLASMSVSGADVQDTALTEKMIDAMRTGGGEWLASLLAAAPSAAIARTLQRRMIAAWDEAVADGPAGVAAQLFALPIVIVAGKSSGSAPSLIEAVITEPERVRAILLEHAALAGNRNFALANALASADAIDLPRLPELLSWTHALDSSATQARSVEPAPIALSMEGAVHLRFLVGTALTAPRAPLFAESGVGAWGLPLARELARRSSAFDSRQAEGFRCPLFPGERASDVAAMLGALMRDCRVANVHVLPGVHPDHDPATGLTLLFKAELLEAEPRASLQ